MNIFKNLVIKILCCAIVCTAIIPDVYGMKKRKDHPDATEELRNSSARRVRQRITGPELEASASQPEQQPEQPSVFAKASPDKMDTSSASSQNAPLPQQPAQQHGKDDFDDFELEEDQTETPAPTPQPDSGKRDVSGKEEKQERSGKDEKAQPGNANSMSLDGGYQDPHLVKPKTQAREVSGLDDLNLEADNAFSFSPMQDDMQKARLASLQSLDEDEARRDGKASQSSNSNSGGSCSSSSSHQFETKTPANDDESEDSKNQLEPEEPKVIIKTVDGKHSVQIPVSWFDVLTAVNTMGQNQIAASNRAKETKDAQTHKVEVAEEFCKHFEFTSLKELGAFKQVLKRAQKKKYTPRALAQRMADYILNIMHDAQQIYHLLEIAEHVGFPVLKLACVMRLIERYPNVIEHLLTGPFKDFIEREMRFKRDQATAQDFAYLPEHGFLPVWECVLSDNEQEFSKALYDLFSQDPRRDEFIKQLPQSIRTGLVVRLLQENSTKQDFNFIQLYRMLPEGIDDGSVRCLVLDALDKEAQKYYAKFIKDKKEPEQKDTVEKLPAGYFKMRVRLLQQGITDGFEVAPLQPFLLSNIIEPIATPGNEVHLVYMGIGMVKGLIGDVIDLLIQRDTLEPITFLDLSYNRLETVEGLNQLRNLTVLYLYFNRLTHIQLDQLVNLTNLSLLQNQLTCIEGLNKLAKLTTLELSYNKLATLNVAGLSQLESLNCECNQLQELDVSSLIHLKTLDAHANRLIKLNVNGLPNLKEINLWRNLDLTSQPDFDAIVQALRNRGIDVTIE